MRTTYKLHQRVNVVNTGWQYKTYSKWFDENCPELKQYFEKGADFFPDQYGIFYVVAKGYDSEGTEIYAISRDLSPQEGSRVYLVGVDGLSKIPSGREAVEELADKAFMLYSALYKVLAKEDPENVSSRIDFMTNLDLSYLSNEYKELQVYKMLKEMNLNKIELTHPCSLEQWQDYLAYKKIEPEIKGCLDREKELIIKNKKLEDSQYKEAIATLRTLRSSVSWGYDSDVIKEEIDEMIEKLERKTLYIENRRTIEVLQGLAETIEANKEFVQDKWLPFNLLRYIDKKIEELKQENKDECSK